MQECQAIYGLRDDLLLCGTKEAALRGADALLICTEWKSFRAPAFDALKDALTTPVIFDGRNLYDPKVIARYGIEYFSIGRMAA
jgi:UDPglucose 6-dehydrogenase